MDWEVTIITVVATLALEHATEWFWEAVLEVVLPSLVEKTREIINKNIIVKNVYRLYKTISLF